MRLAIMAFWVVASSALAPCVPAAENRQPSSSPSIEPRSTAIRVGIDPAAIDTSVDACDDFYLRACGGFIKATPVDASTPVVDMNQRVFEANLDRNLRHLFEQDTAGNAELARLATFYRSCLASASTARSADVDTVSRWLRKVDAVATPQEIQALIRDFNRIGVDPFFSYGGRPDRTNWARYRGEIHNSRLWAEPAVVERAFVLAGRSAADAGRDASAVASMTAALAQHRANRWDAATAENPRSLAQLEALAPAIDWRRYFDLVGASPSGVVNVTSPDYLKAVDRELANRSIEDLRAYFRWAFLFSLRGELPAPYNAAFADINPALRVLVNDLPGRCREATVRAMGVEFSRQYAEGILGRSARDAARDMAQNIRQEIIRSIDSNPWLSTSARLATVDKLKRTDLKIGFPDRWPAVGSYALSGDRFFDNVLAAREFEQHREWRRAGTARSARDWEMKVQPWVGEGMAAARLVVPNGYPDALSNSLFMTAAFLEPPRFDAAAPIELNYATFGALFAHEMVHVVEAHEFGPDGRSAELWKPEDEKKADALGSCLVQQADGYQPLPGLTMPGQRQYGENVADYGGIRLAHEALSRRMGSRMQERDASGMTLEQRFFYRYAQNWCAAQTDDNLRQSVESDVHAPPAFRVNGPLSNLPAFGEAFQCKATSKMARGSDRCRVW